MIFFSVIFGKFKILNIFLLKTTHPVIRGVKEQRAGGERNLIESYVVAVFGPALCDLMDCSTTAPHPSLSPRGLLRFMSIGVGDAI